MYLSVPLNRNAMEVTSLDDFQKAVFEALSVSEDGDEFINALKIGFQGLTYKVSPLLGNSKKCVLEIFDKSGESLVCTNAKLQISESFTLDASREACVETMIFGFLKSKVEALKLLTGLYKVFSKEAHLLEMNVSENCLLVSLYKTQCNKCNHHLDALESELSVWKASRLTLSSWSWSYSQSLKVKIRIYREQLGKLKSSLETSVESSSVSLLTSCKSNAQRMLSHMQAWMDDAASEKTSHTDLFKIVQKFIKAASDLEEQANISTTIKEDLKQYIGGALNVIEKEIECLSVAELFEVDSNSLNFDRVLEESFQNRF